MTTTSLREAWLSELAPTIATVASRFARTFRQWAETEDIQQELAIWVMQHTRQLAEWQDRESEKGFDRLVYKSLSHAAKDYCIDMKMQGLGYSKDDLAWYSKTEIKGLLKYVFNKDDWINTPGPKAEGNRSKDAAKGGNWVTSLVDMAKAVESLNANELQLVKAHLVEEVTQKELGDALGVTQQTVSDRLDRIYAKLREELGGWKPSQQAIHPDEDLCDCYLGTRRAISNAHARALTDANYEEE